MTERDNEKLIDSLVLGGYGLYPHSGNPNQTVREWWQEIIAAIQADQAAVIRELRLDLEWAESKMNPCYVTVRPCDECGKAISKIKPSLRCKCNAEATDEG